MKKRLAYIGTSYPIAYDYEHTSKTDNNDYLFPNPIIESPMGLLILYDELWFLCEALCPENMRKLPYVKFVDKEYKDIYLGDLHKYKDNKKDFLLDISEFNWKEFDNIYKSFQGYNRLDSHGRHINVCGEILNTICNDKTNILVDMYILQILEEKTGSSLDYVSNRLYTWGDPSDFKNFNDCKNNRFAEEIVLHDIPNYISFQGPYHDCIEDLRNDKLLVAFREWIVSKKVDLDNKEILDLVSEVNNRIEACKNDIFLKNIDSAKYRMFSSISKTIITTAFTQLGLLDLFSTIFKSTVEFNKIKKYSWQGFVVRARNTLKLNIL